MARPHGRLERLLHPHREAHTSVLVADDDDDVRELVAWVMRSAGHEVAEAPDGQAALDQMVDHRWDLAVLDIGMPGMSGLEVLASLRERHTDCGPIIVLTGCDDPDVRQEARNLGADAYLTKPFVLADLRVRAQDLIAAGR